MKILVLGSGGREHALVWALQKTSAVTLEIFCAPGNAGIGQISNNVPISLSDHSTLSAFASSNRIDLTIVGPEAPLVAGIVDHFQSKNLAVVGPTAAASRLEGSKVFAKDFMANYGIPTATYQVADNVADAIEIVRSGEFGQGGSPLVIKADGLAAGKGVYVAPSPVEAEEAIVDLMVNHVAGKEAAQRIVVEEALDGPEASLLVFSDGRDYALMPPARDHKRIGENDTGPNTGGMGTVTDSTVIEKTMLDRAVKEIVEPTLVGARREGFPFRGVLFFGLMLTREGPKLLEYNVRFGDPETQAIMVRLQSDLLSVFQATCNGTLGDLSVDWAAGASACVVVANRGYPGPCTTGSRIEGLDQSGDERVQVFHAGTSLSPRGELIASGGRVLGVTAAAETLPESLKLCYDSLEAIHWDGMQYRRDIGRPLHVS